MTLFIFYIVINLAALALFGLDKMKAQRHLWRIPEKVLLGISFLGGAFGGLAGMLFFHHKTRKPIFMTLVPLFAVGHILLIVFIF